MTLSAPTADLQIELPTPPHTLAALSRLLADEDVNMLEMSRLIEHDMSLAAAMMKAVNSPLYGLRGRAQNVQQAITYLGTREVAAMCYEIGLRAAFPQAAVLQPIWERAAVRGLLMGRLAKELYMDAWCAHTAGLFEECGKAALFRYAPEAYGQMLKSAKDDSELVALSQAQFGIGHDELGARLCESWGLDPGAVACVRYHVQMLATHHLPTQSPRRGICVLSALAHTLMTQPDRLDDVALAYAPQAMLDQTLLLKGARRVKDKIDSALADA